MSFIGKSMNRKQTFAAIAFVSGRSELAVQEILQARNYVMSEVLRKGGTYADNMLVKYTAKPEMMLVGRKGVKQVMPNLAPRELKLNPKVRFNAAFKKMIRDTEVPK